MHPSIQPSPRSRFKIAEVHLLLDLEFTQRNIERVNRSLQRAVELELPRIEFAADLVYTVNATEGSLKDNITIFGVLLAEALSNYGSLRQGIDQAYKDAIYVAERVVSIAKVGDPVIEDNLRTYKTNAGIIEKIKKTFDKIETLERNLDNKSRNEIEDDLLQAKQDLTNLIHTLRYDDQRTFLKSMPDSVRYSLPPVQPEVATELYVIYALKPDEIYYPVIK